MRADGLAFRQSFLHDAASRGCRRRRCARSTRLPGLRGAGHPGRAAARAHAWLEDGRHTGKVVLVGSRVAGSPDADAAAGMLPACPSKERDMATVLITGANRGIGLALAQRYAARGDAVIGVCRHGSDALARTGARVEAGVDVTDGAAVEALARRLGDVRIDTLVLNAGILERDSLGQLDAAGFDAMRRQFEVNALGPLREAHALRDRLADGGKVGIITSRMGSVADNGSGGYYGYRASKAAVNAIGKSLSLDLKPRGIAVVLLHPGYVATEMVGGSGDVTPAQAATQLVARLDALTLEYSGSFWHANGDALPW
jgi:NAD(P)-dependent dehydrogenase (short-subunit alcohol dehydrogenase family)